MQDGYVADIDYTYGYYSELNPHAARFVLLTQGIAPPPVHEACELGFGQGVSINMHAAASRTRWWGTDFLAPQAAFAQELATASGSGATISQESFDEFCHRPDLPDMDFIGLHGIWTWVNAASRQTIVDFIRRKLKPGGIVYASYNTQPGWANVIPMRELFLEYADAVGGPGQGTGERIDTAIDFTKRFLATHPRFVQGNQLALQQIEHITRGDRHYLAHEFFNDDWEPMSFANFARAMAPAQLEFACSGNQLENVEGLYITPAQLQLVQSVPDARVRQSVRDYVLNANFRRDYWVRGARRLQEGEQRALLEQQLVVLAQRPEYVNLKVENARLNPAVYQPVLQALADLKPRAVGDIAREVARQNVGFTQLVQALVILQGKFDLLPVLPPEERTPQNAQRLNRHVIELARTKRAPVNYLASSLSGGAIYAPQADQLQLGDKAFAGARADVYRAHGVV